MNTVDVKSNTYSDSSKEITNKDRKFKIGGIARMSKCKNIFAKCYTPNLSEELVPRTYAIDDLDGEKLLESSTKKNFKKQIKNILELKK